MNKPKKILSILLLCLLLFTTAACTQQPAENTDSGTNDSQPKTTVKIAALNGPTGMGLVNLMTKQDNGTAENNYEFTMSSAPDQVSASVIKGEPDLAAVPVNLAATLYQKTNGQYVVCAINTLGVLYMLDTTDTIHSVADLKGQTIYATGQGSTPEYILRYVLSANGIDSDKDVTIEFKADHAELATLVKSGQAPIAMLPEPNVTSAMMGTDNVKIALNMTEEWDKVSTDGSTVVQGCILVKKSFLEQNQTAYDQFMEDYRESVDFVTTNIDQAAQAIAQYEIVPKAEIAQKAIPNCNIALITGEEMKTKLKPFLEILYQYNNASVGGSLPDDNFYYTAQ